MTGKIETIALVIIALCAVVVTGEYTSNVVQQRKRDAAMGFDEKMIDRLSELRAEHEAADDRSAKDRMLSDANTIGAALLAYAKQTGGLLPPKGSWSQRIKLQPGTDISKFVYKQGLVDAASLRGTDELGYIPFIGGRAVAMANGHSKLVDSN